MNHPAYFAAYSSYHLPLHLPEVYWILEQTHARLKLAPPKTILDLGCGPGTLTLSYLLWAAEHGWPAPEEIILVDFSKQALEGARKLVSELIGPKTKLRTIRADLRNKRSLAPSLAADWVFAGHILNEWGNGPRVREQKLEFLEGIFNARVLPGGHLFLIEPPLREPTLDLMWLRDELAQNIEPNPVVAPCPSGALYCPMLRRSLGWCYAQPPRTWAGAKGLAPWDKDIRRLLDIRLQNFGFAYLVLHQPADVEDTGLTAQETAAPHAIAITDENARRGMLCTKSGLKEVSAVPHRGAYVVRPPKADEGSDKAEDAPVKDDSSAKRRERFGKKNFRSKTKRSR